MAHLDFSKLNEEERVATYGAFFAMASIDGTMDDAELVQILECLDLDGLSDSAMAQVRSFLIQTPPLDQILAPLVQSSNEIRYGVLVHLMDVALADEVYAPAERQAINAAGDRLGATREQLGAIENFIRELRGIESGMTSIDDADERMQTASYMLQKTGVPLDALVMSSGAAALSAGGVSAATIGALGLALAPGVGLAAASGAAAYFAMRLFMTRPAKPDPEIATRARRVVGHLRMAIEDTRDEITRLESQGRTSADHQARLNKLNDRVLAMQRLLARKRGELQ